MSEDLARALSHSEPAHPALIPWVHYRAAAEFLEDYPDAVSFRVTLYGSLAATGKGHLTDVAIREALNERKVEFIWKPSEVLPLHPNGMLLEAMGEAEEIIGAREEYSVGGGALLSDGEAHDLYPAKTLAEILTHCEKSGESFWEYVGRIEGEDIWNFLDGIWSAMCDAIERGLESEGTLPGELGLARKARALFRKSTILGPEILSDALLAAYAYAVAEENACGGRVVTAPTCGSSGVLPAVLYYLKSRLGCSRMDITRALATAGLFGKHRQIERIDLGSRRWLPGGSGYGLCHGGGSGNSTAGGKPETDRVCRGDGAGTSPWPDVRPSARPCANPMY